MAEEDELKTITGEESLGNFMELVQKLKDEPWTSRLNDILDDRRLPDNSSGATSVLAGHLCRQR